MVINKQLFEDVLSGKLTGRFVFKNVHNIYGVELKPNHTCIQKSSTDGFYIIRMPSLLFNVVNTEGKSVYGCTIHKGEGKNDSNYDIIDFIPDTVEIDPEMYSYNQKDIQFIEHFINDYHMKENELTVEIPDGKIVDWDESKKQNKIVLKDKQLTYEDVCEKLFKDDHYSIAWEGYPIKCCSAIYNASNATSEHQLECILAKNMLANVAIYLNDGWKPNVHEPVYRIASYVNNDNKYSNLTPRKEYFGTSFCSNNVIFKSEELAQRAIEILGEETINLALEPLGV